MQGDLSPEESLRLLTGCREDNELSRRFVHLMQVESMTKLVRKDDDDFSAEMAPRLKRGKILRWVAGWAAVAALDQRDASLLRLSLRLRLCLRLYALPLLSPLPKCLPFPSFSSSFASS